MINLAKVSLDELTTLSNGVECYIDNDDIISIFKREESSSVLLCLLPSAQNSNMPVKEVFFSRWKWHSKFPFNVINISDPALKEHKLHGTWFLDKTTDHIKNISEFVSKTAKILGLEKIIFYGSSMGGFSALMCASEVKNSYAIAEVPQLDLRKYFFKNAISLLEEKNLSNENIDSFYERHPERVSVIERFNKNSKIPNAMIITNRMDQEFIDHLNLTVELFSDIKKYKESGDITYEIKVDGGHSTLSEDDIMMHIHNIAKRNFSDTVIIDDLLNSSDYKAVLQEAIEITKSVKYIRDQEDASRYNNAIAMLNHAANINLKADWPLLKMCAMVKLWNNSYTEELLGYARSAFSRRESIEGFIYLCRGIITHNTYSVAYKEIDAISESSLDHNITTLGKLFLSMLRYELKDYDGYSKLVNEFNKSDYIGERPYIAIPASTVYTGRPSSKYEGAFYGQYPLKLVEFSNRPSYIVSTSVDESYFLKYGEYIVKSFSKSCAHESILHISLINSTEDLIIAKLKEWGAKSVFFSLQSIKTEKNVGPIASLLRFSHVYELISKNNTPVVVLDFDCVIKKSFSDLVFQGNYDVLSRVLGQNVAPWEKYTGGFAVFNSTEPAAEVAMHIANVASKMVNINTCQWWIDQNCFEAGIRLTNYSQDKALVKNIYNIRDEYCFMPVGSGDAKLHVLNNAMSSIGII